MIDLLSDEAKMLQKLGWNLPARSYPVWMRGVRLDEPQVLKDHTSREIPASGIFAMGPALQWRYCRLPPQPCSIDLLDISLFRPPSLLLEHTALAWDQNLPSRIFDYRCLCLVLLFRILDGWSRLEVSHRPPLSVEASCSSGASARR